MRERAKRVVLNGIDRALAARGFEGRELDLAREDTLEWARTRVRALRTRRGVAGGVGVLVTRPGHAELHPLDVPLAGPGDLTVEVLASAVSPGTERAQWLRLPHAQPSLPFAPGYSVAGRVLAVGPGVTGFAAGDLVAIPRAPHASILTVEARWAVPVPSGVPAEAAALVYLAIIAGYGVRRAGPLGGESLCVLGTGPIGALAQRLAQLQQPGPVTVVAASRRGESAALRAGATRFLTAGKGTTDIGAAVVIEATGDPDAIAPAVAAARDGATIVLLGSPRGVSRDIPVAEIQARRLRVVGAHVSALATEARRDGVDPFASLAGTFLDAVASGALDVGDLTGEAIDPREIERFYRRLATGEVSAAHLDWTRVPREQRIRMRRAVAPPQLHAFPGSAGVAPARLPTAAPASDRSLRFALIGCGDIGLHNARGIAAASGAELTLCHDADTGLAQATADRCGGRVAASIDEALDPTIVDAVFLCVPHDLHAPLAVRAAQAGLHVVIEKPLASDLEGAEQAVSAAAAADVALSACFCFRYEPAIQTARELVRDGALGELRGATIVFHADKPASYWVGGFSGRATSGWRASRARSGGGVLIMNVLHYIDMLRYIAGAKPAWVAGTQRTAAGAEIEDAFALSVGFDNGAIGSFSGSASTRGAPPNRFEMWGDSGTVVLEPDPAVWTERAIGGVVPGRWSKLPREVPDDPRRIFVERFAADVLAGRPPEVSGADGLAAQAFVSAAYEAMESGARVAIPAYQGAMP